MQTVRIYLNGRHEQVYARTEDLERLPVPGMSLGLSHFGIPSEICPNQVYDTEDGRAPICQVVVDDAVLARIVLIDGWERLHPAA